MAATSEISADVRILRNGLDELRTTISSLRHRYGDVPAVLRLVGDLDRFELDVTDLEGLVSVAAQPASRGEHGGKHGEAMTVIDDRPLDPSLWADCDDEGLGGYHR